MFVAPASAGIPALTLPATGLIFNQWIPIVAAILLVLGAIAIAYTILSRRKARASAEAAEVPSAEHEPDQDTFRG